MAKLTANQALARLPYKQYLSLREVWKDLKLFNTVIYAAAPAKKIKMVKDALDDMTLEQLKKARIKSPKNIQVVKTKPQVIKKVAAPTKPTKQETSKPIKQLKVTPPSKDTEVKEFDTLAPTFTGPMTDVSNNFKGLDAVTISPDDKAQFDSVNNTLAEMMHQREIISNIVNSLKGGFANIGDDSTDNIAKATAYSEKIYKTINVKIAELRNVMHKSTQAIIPKSFNNLVNNVYNDVKARLNTSTTHKISIMFACGTGSKGGFQLTAFLIFKDVATDHGTMPLYVVALSLAGTDYYINCSLLRVPTFNKFTLGYKLPINSNGNPIPAIAKRYIDEQFALIGNMAAVRTVPVPPQLEGMQLQNLNNVDSVNMTDESIGVTFKPNIVSAKQAQEAANNIYIVLNNSLYMYDPKNKIQIRTTNVGQSEASNQWWAIFMFSKADAISGRTLHRDEVDYLSKIFNQDDIKKIRFVLSSDKSKPSKKAA